MISLIPTFISVNTTRVACKMLGTPTTQKASAEMLACRHPAKDLETAF